MGNKSWSVEVDSQPPPAGETRVRRSYLHPQGLVDHVGNNIQTIYGVIEHAATEYPHRPLLGARKVLDVIEEEKQVIKEVDGKEVKQLKTWQYYKLSPYNWMTCREVFEYAKELGYGLVNKGVKAGEKVLIAAPTSREWMLMALASYTQRLTVVTAYDTLGLEGLLHAQKQSNVPVIFVDVSKLQTVVDLARQTDTLRLVVYMGESDRDSMCIQELNKMNIDVVPFEKLHKHGQKHPTNENPSKPDDLALIMYTSGSTGMPKGVQILHRNMVCISGGIDLIVGKYIVPEDECLLAYLPLAHVLEIMVEVYILYKGIRLGYGSVRTLSSINLRECDGDLKELKPSIMLGVPQVWDTIRGGALRQVKNTSKFAAKIFGGAISFKSWLMHHHLPTFFVDPIFKPVKEAVGGRMKFVITGGAPISAATLKFIRSTLCPMIQGYGMTEASGLVSVQEPVDLTTGNVGTPCPSVEVKLVDAKEAGYYAKNNQGEILLHGPSIFQGYLNNEEETKKTMTKDGWLRTGDVGEWRRDGQLAIIDRVKNLVKLANGEYIALERLESLYKNSLVVDNVCLCANSQLRQPVALVMPNKGSVEKWAEANQMDTSDWDELCQMPSVRKFIMNDLLQVARTNKMLKPEMISDVRLISDPWTQENGMLTAAQKLRRKPIEARYKDDLEEMYANQAKH